MMIYGLVQKLSKTLRRSLQVVADRRESRARGWEWKKDVQSFSNVDISFRALVWLVFHSKCDSRLGDVKGSNESP